MPGLHPRDVHNGIVEQAKFMGIDIIQKVELKNLFAWLLTCAFLIEVHHVSDGDLLPTEELPGDLQEMFTEFQGLLGELTYANLQTGRQADFENKTDPNRTIPFS